MVDRQDIDANLTFDRAGIVRDIEAAAKKAHRAYGDLAVTGSLSEYMEAKRHWEHLHNLAGKLRAEWGLNR